VPSLPRRASIGAAALLSLTFVLAGAVAQDGAGGVTGPGTACDVTPRSLADLVALGEAAGDLRGEGTPPASGQPPMAFAGGAPAEPEVMAAVEQAVRTALACRASGDALWYYALFTDRYLEEAFATGQLTQESILAFSRDASASPQHFVSLGSVRVLDDGRVSAVVVVAEGPGGTSSPPDRSVVVFGYVLMQVDGAWLIDALEPLATFSPDQVDAAFAASTGPSPSVPTSDASIRLEAYDLGWRTADQPGPQVNLTVAPGSVIELANTGAAPHNFSVDDLGIDVDMPVGFTGSVTIPADAPPGEYRFICAVPGHAAIMFGTLTVDPTLTPADGTAPTETAAPAGSVRLEGFDIGWRTDDQPGPQVELTVRPGATIELVNVGAGSHSFRVDALGIAQDMPVGFRGWIAVPSDAAPGRYEFICDVPGHAPAGMTGVLVVV
jgi:plastocyanin